MSASQGGAPVPPAGSACTEHFPTAEDAIGPMSDMRTENEHWMLLRQEEIKILMAYAGAIDDPVKLRVIIKALAARYIAEKKQILDIIAEGDES